MPYTKPQLSVLERASLVAAILRICTITLQRIASSRTLTEDSGKWLLCLPDWRLQRQLGLS